MTTACVIQAVVAIVAVERAIYSNVVREAAVCTARRVMRYERVTVT